MGCACSQEADYVPEDKKPVKPVVVIPNKPDPKPIIITPQEPDNNTILPVIVLPEEPDNKKEETINPKNDPTKLTETDYKFLIAQTDLTREQIIYMVEKFDTNNQDGKLDINEFVRLYTELRQEIPELVEQTARHIFKGFDADNSGSINFNEFIVIINIFFLNRVDSKIN